MKNLIDVYIHRESGDDQGTEGVLSIPELSFSCYSLELPWRDNQQEISCIPPGTYPMAWHVSAKYTAFRLDFVPGRTGILIHAGNLAGDIFKGFKSHSEGCILLGQQRGKLLGQTAVLLSRVAVDRFNALLEGKTCRITISGPPEAMNG